MKNGFWRFVAQRCCVFAQVHLVVGVLGFTGVLRASEAVVGEGLVRHAPEINGRVEGSLQQLLPEPMTLNGGGTITTNLRVLGLPTVRINGKPTYGGTMDGTGAATPSNYQITLNGGATLGHVVRRTNAVPLLTVAAPPAPKGTRDLIISTPGQSVGNFSTLRNLTLSGNAGQLAVPPGNYGTFIANSNCSFTVGVAGSTMPSVYNFQQLTLNGGSQFIVVGPVVVTVASGFTADGHMGTSRSPSWLTLNIYSGDFTLNGGINFWGFVSVPNGKLIVNGNSQLIGGLSCDRLLVNGAGLVRLTSGAAENHSPLAFAQAVTLNEDTSAPVTLVGTDADGDALVYTIVDPPSHGTLSGSGAARTYVPTANYYGNDAFSFKVNDGTADSSPAVVSLTINPINDRPTAAPLPLTLLEDTSKSLTLSGADLDGDPLTFSVTKDPVHGSLTLTGATVVYTPQKDYNGPDRFEYVSDDGMLSSIPAAVTITVQPVNDAPVANSRTLSVDEGASLPILLTGSDIDGDPLTYAVVTSVTHGTLTGTAPNLTYRPTANYGGMDTFTFKVNDGTVDSAVATITIQVSNLNDAPSAQSAVVSLKEDTSAAFKLQASDPDGDVLTYIPVALPQHGVISGTAPNLVYTPQANFNGVDTFTFKVKDPGNLESQVATITLQVEPVNDAPEGNYQSFITPEDKPIAFTLTGSDIDGDALTYTVVALPQHGSLSGTAPNLTYTPSLNYNGSDAFTFKVNDGKLDSPVVTVDIDILPVNDAPVALPQSVTTNEDTAVAILLAGTDTEGSPLTYDVVRPPLHGKLTIDGAHVTYTPALNFDGPTDSFEFTANDDELTSSPATVTITVKPINDAPVATDQTIPVVDGAAVNLTLSATDVDSPSLNYTVLTAPVHGTLSGTAPNLVFTPARGYSGSDTLTFKANDGSLDSNIGKIVFTISVTNHAPIAADQTVSVVGNTSVALTLTATDADNDVLKYTVLTSPTHGALSGTAPNLTYTPTTGFQGSDSFTFNANDTHTDSNTATITITVTAPANRIPVADAQTVTVVEDTPKTITLTGSDPDGTAITYKVITNPAHGQLTGTAPALTYTPDANYSGDDSFVFTVNDGTGDSLPAVVSITVTPVNDAPVAVDQTITVKNGAPADIVLSATDTDSTVLSYTVLSAPAHGSLTGTAPSLTYTPAGGYSGSDSFTFKANDGALDSNVATVYVLVVAPQNRPPLAESQLINTLEDSAKAIVLKGSDPDGDTLNYTIKSQPSHGTLAGTAPAIIYIPDADYCGRDVFSFTVSDGTTVSSGTIDIIVDCLNDRPVASSSTYSVSAGKVLPITLRGADVDGDSLSYSVVAGPTHGILGGSAPNITYASDPTFSGTDQFTFKVNDGQLDSDVATITIQVAQSINQPPQVDAGPDRLVVMHASSIKGRTAFLLTPISTRFNTPIGIDYHPTTNNVIMSVNYSGGMPYNFELVDRNGERHQFSSIAGLTEELKIATVKEDAAGFVRGEFFSGSGVPGVIIRVSADGSVVQNPWVTLPGETGLMRGSLYVDRTGIYGHDLIVVTTAGGVWRINSAGVSTHLAEIGTHLEGLSTIPDNPQKYGPWAGKILIGAEGQTRFYTVDPAGVVGSYDLGIQPEDIDIIPINENFYGVGYADQRLYGAPASAFIGMEGDLMVAQEFPGILWHVWWDGTAFQKEQLGLSVSQWEHVTFAPAGMVEIEPVVAPASITLEGSVTDDGLPYPSALKSSWSVTSGPASVQFGDAANPTSTAGFNVEGEYILTLRGDDGELSAHDETKVTVVINHAPEVDAGPDVMASDATKPVTLKGKVTDDGYPRNTALTVQWTKEGGPGEVTFGSPTTATTTATFSIPGIYALRLTATDGLDASTDTVEVRVGLPCQVDDLQGMVAWWPGNYTAEDHVIGADGALSNVSYVPGKVSAAFDFSAPKSAIRVKQRAELDVGSSAEGFSFDFWVNPTLAQDGDLFEWDRADGQGLQMYLSGGSYIYLHLPYQNQYGIYLGAVDVWHHVVLTFTKSTRTIRWFIDGVLRQEFDPGAVAFKTNGGDLYLGAIPDRGRKFSGLLDEITFYNRPLTTTEAFSLYKAGEVGKCPMINNIAPEVNAGPDQQLRESGGTVTLKGTVRDDGRPEALSTAWTQVSGPRSAIISAAGKTETSVSFSEAGIYNFELTAYDGYSSRADVVQVRVGEECLAEPPSGLVAWWSMDHAPTDLVSGKNATSVQMKFVPGAVSEAADFQDPQSYIRVTERPELDVGSSSEGFSFEFWVNPKQARDGDLFQWDRPDSQGLQMYLSGGSYIYLHLPYQNQYGMYLGAVDAWHHVVLTFTKSTRTARWYIDGVLRQEFDPGAVQFKTSGGDLYLGGIPLRSRKFLGQLDEVSFYNRPLTSPQAFGLYKAGASGKCLVVTNEPPAVDAGNDQLLLNPRGSVTLRGTAADDGKPYGNLVVRWQKVGGPDSAVIVAPNALETSVNFTEPGIYDFELAASDGYSTRSDVVQIRVGDGCVVESPTGLVGWWGGDHRTLDVVNGSSGVPVEMKYSAGVVGEAFDFTTPQSYVRIPEDRELDVGSSTEGFSFEFWVNPKVAQDGDLFQWDRGDSQGLQMYLSGGSYIYLHLPYQNQYGIYLGATDAWHHVVLTFTKNTRTVRWYIDGVLRQEFDPGAVQFKTSGGDLYLGGIPLRSRKFVGLLDELSFYNRPLTTTEAFALYKAGASGKCPLVVSQPPAVDAGPDRMVKLSTEPVILKGTVVDDAKPVSELVVQWRKLSGPDGSVVASPASAVTSVSFTQPGIYDFELSASDGYSISSDVVQVRVGDRCVVEPPTGLVAWWGGDHRTLDVIGGTAGTPVRIKYAPGTVAEAFDFSEPQSYIRIAERPELDIGSSAEGFSFEFWVNPKAPQDGDLFQWDRGDSQGLQMYLSGGSYIYLHLPYQNQYGLYLGSADVWHHVVLTFTKNTRTLRWYIDGVLRQEFDPGAVVFKTNGGDLYLGGIPLRSRKFVGWLDELSFYNRPLSTIEAFNLYNAGAAGKCPVIENSPPAVDAGPNQQLTQTMGTIVLRGTVADDGEPYGELTTQWKQVSGPSGASIASPDSPQTGVQFYQSGIYVFELSASDGYSTSTDVVEIRAGSNCVAAPPAGLVAWWPANHLNKEVVTNSAGAAVQLNYAPGPVSEAFDFRVSQSFLKVTERPEFDVGSSPDGFTFEFWVNSTVGQDGDLFQWDRGDQQGLLMYLSGGSYIYLNLPYQNQYGVYLGALNTWHHVGLTFTKATRTLRWYIDGVLKQEQDAGAVAFRTSGGDLYFGGIPLRSRKFTGLLDEISFYSRPLSAEELRLIYDSSVGKCPLPQANQAPVVNAGGDRSASFGSPVPLTAVAVDDGLPISPGSLAFQWSKVSGPGSLAFSAPTASQTTVTFSAVGSYVVRVAVNDGELTGEDTINFNVIAPPSVALTTQDGRLGYTNQESFTLVAAPIAADGTVKSVEVFRISSDAFRTSLGLKTSAPYSWPQGTQPAGDYRYVAVTIDSNGVKGESPLLQVKVVEPTVAVPIAFITTPNSGSEVGDLVEIIGTVTSPIIKSWTLQYRLKSSDDSVPWLNLNSGSAEVTGGVLGVFDPTRVRNGIYELRIIAADQLNRPQSPKQPTYVVVTGHLKVGQYTRSTVDLMIPTPGIPLRVIRYYDSYDKEVGDFGPGTAIATTDYRAQVSRKLGEGWFAYTVSGQLNLPFFQVDPAPPQDATVDNTPPAPRVVTITLPNNEVFRFSARLTPNHQIAEIEAGRIVFDPMPGTVGSLVPLNASGEVEDEVLTTAFQGETDLVDYFNFEPLDPVAYRLTTLDGMQYVISTTAGVMQVSDRNGNTVTYERDRIIHSNGVAIQLIRDAQGRITEVRDPAGQKIAYNYDPQGRLITVTDREGKATTFGYFENSSLMTSIQEPAAIRPEYNAFDAYDRFVKGISANGSSFLTSRDDAAKTETKEDPLGHKTTYKYDIWGNVTEVTDALGQVTKYKFGNTSFRAKPTEVTDAAGHVTIYTYNSQGLKSSVTDANGHTTSFTYDAYGEIVTETDALGKTLTNTYDGKGNLVGTKDREGAVTTYTYDNEGNVLTTKDALGSERKYNYNSLGLPVTESLYSVSGTLVYDKAFGYDLDGNLTQESQVQHDGSGTVHSVIVSHTYNKNGQPTATTFPDGTTEKRVYNSQGRLESISDRLGLIRTYSYNDLGAESRVTYQDGSYEEKLFDSVGRVTSTRSVLGHVTSYTYDDADRLIGVKLPDGTQTARTYDPVGRITSETDEGGRTTTTTYDPVGNPTKIVYPDGTAANLVYNEVDLLTDASPRVFFEQPLSVVMAFGSRAMRGIAVDSMPGPGDFIPAFQPSSSDILPRKFHYDYDGNHRVVRITRPDFAFSEITYDSVGRVTQTTNEAGIVWNYEYAPVDATRRTAVYGPLGYAEHYEYDELGNIIAYTDSLGRKTINTYNYYDLIQTQYPDGSYEQYTRSNGKLIESRDRAGMVTTYTDSRTGRSGDRVSKQIIGGENYVTTESYDAAGNLVKVVDPRGAVTIHAYDYWNRCISSELPLGLKVETVYGPRDTVKERREIGGAVSRVTKQTYDSNDFLKQTVRPDGSIIDYTFAPDGRLLTVTAPYYPSENKRTTSYTYDDVARITKVTDSLGNTTTKQFDALGRLISVTDAAGVVTKHTYDQLNRLTESIEALNNNLQRSIQTTYDLAGNILTTTKAAGSTLALTTSYTYDEADRLLKATYPDGGSENRAYDGAGRLINFTTRRGKSISYSYDDLGRLISTTAPGRGTAFHAYSDHGGTEAITDALNQKTKRTYDERNRLVSEELPFEGAIVERGYDEFGRLTSATDRRGNTSYFQYDEIGRMVATILPDGATRRTQYSGAGEPTVQTDARGAVTKQSYDLPGRVTSIKRIGLLPADDRITSYTYDSKNRVTGIQLPTGQSLSAHYDTLGRMTSRSIQVDAVNDYTEAFTYDLRDNILTQSDGRGDTKFTYDAAGRVLTAANPLGGVEKFEYDQNGNRTSFTDANDHTTKYSYDAADRLSSIEYPFGTVEAFTYDAEDHVVTHTKTGTDGSSIETFTYDDLDSPISVTRGTGAEQITEFFKYDGMRNLLSHTDPEGYVTSYKYDTRNRVMRIDYPDGLVTQFEYDPESAVTKRTDTGGNLTRVNQSSYNAFGELISSVDPLSHTTNYTYDKGGHVKSLTDPLGRVSSNEYDLGGRRIASIRPDGRRTEYKYDIYGRRVGIVDPAGSETRFEYDALGRLTRAQTPLLDTLSPVATHLIDPRNTCYRLFCDRKTCRIGVVGILGVQPR